MALTGKTIGQLTYLQYPTNDTLIPVELSGDTYHISFSAVNYTETTYTDLGVGATAAELTPGQYYLMTDFQTCYDQPNYDSTGNPITTGNYKTGTTEPILLLATSTTGFSPTVYSILYPQDKISYDFTWNTTEVTGSPAKGRITERIDEKNNRTDYDFRAVQFIRYVGYFSERYYPGKIDLDATTGRVIETTVGTRFTNDFTVGDIFGVYYPGGAPLSCFQYYEITSIVSDTEMYVTGRTLTSVNNVYYSNGLRLPNYMSPFQCNITGTTNDESSEYYTFNSNNNFNTFIGNNNNYNTFLLSNNVFLSGSYNNNTFGGNFVGNTLNDDMDSNTIGSYCQFNIITNDFDRNNVGSYFQYNIIDCDMESNQIGNYFEHNMIGDDDGQDFDFNTIGPRFSANFLTFSNNDFINNKIGYRFYNNLIDSGFANNQISGNFFDNLIRNQSFNNNIIGEFFYQNNIPVTFRDNTIGSEFFQNNVYSLFNENTFGQNVNTNTFGDPNNFVFSFTNNNVGGDFTGNYFSGNTQYNTIKEGCGSNNVDTNFSYNQIGTNFTSNIIANDFGFGGGVYRGNIIGNGFNANIIGEYCYNNTFGDDCYNNNLTDYFTNNKISYGMNNTTTLDLDGAGNFQNNNITYGYFQFNLTLTGGTGGNPILYSQYTTNIMKDSMDNGVYVTFLSGGTIIAQTITI